MSKIMIMTVLAVMCMLFGTFGILPAPVSAQTRSTLVSVTNTTANPVPVTTIKYGVAGVTTEQTTGNTSLRNKNNICQDELGVTTARTCTSEEVIKSSALSAITGYIGWVQPVITGAVSTTEGVLVVDLASGAAQATLNCNNWTSSAGSDYGLAWGNSYLVPIPCNENHRVICCTPQAISP